MGILLEPFLRLLAAGQRLVGRADVLVRCVLLVDGRLGGIVFGALGVGLVLVDRGRVLVGHTCALVGVGCAKVGVGGVLPRGSDRVRIHGRLIPGKGRI